MRVKYYFFLCILDTYETKTIIIIVTIVIRENVLVISRTAGQQRGDDDGAILRMRLRLRTTRQVYYRHYTRGRSNKLTISNSNNSNGNKIDTYNNNNDEKLCKYIYYKYVNKAIKRRGHSVAETLDNAAAKTRYSADITLLSVFGGEHNGFVMPMCILLYDRVVAPSQRQQQQQQQQPCVGSLGAVRWGGRVRWAGRVQVVRSPRFSVVPR